MKNHSYFRMLFIISFIINFVFLFLIFLQIHYYDSTYTFYIKHQEFEKQTKDAISAKREYCIKTGSSDCSRFFEESSLLRAGVLMMLAPEFINFYSNNYKVSRGIKE
jgi:predicted membrane protein